MDFQDTRLACEYLSAGAISNLIKIGVIDPNIKDAEGDSVLCYKDMKPHVFEIFVENGFDSASLNKKGGASFGKHQKMIADAIKKHASGGNPLIKYDHSLLLFHHKRYLILDVLLDIFKGHPNSVEIINKQDALGNTLLHLLAIKDDFPSSEAATVLFKTIFNKIFAFNPDFTIKNNAGETPIDCCKSVYFRKLYKVEAMLEENKQLKQLLASLTNEIKEKDARLVQITSLLSVSSS